MSVAFRGVGGFVHGNCWVDWRKSVCYCDDLVGEILKKNLWYVRRKGERREVLFA